MLRLGVKKTRFKNLVECFLSNNSKREYDLTSGSPDFCVQLLYLANTKTFEALSKKFQKSSSEWANQFIQQNGFFSLLQSVDNIVNRMNKQNTFSKSLLLLKCLKCIKFLMNINIAVEFLINLGENEGNDTILIFARSNLRTI